MSYTGLVLYSILIFGADGSAASSSSLSDGDDCSLTLYLNEIPWEVLTPLDVDARSSFIYICGTSDDYWS